MREASNATPEIGPTARTLGVRPDDDIPVVVGRVMPLTGGMSVAPDDPGNLPRHRRPPEHGGTGKDPIWGIALGSLSPDLAFRQDKPNHGLFEPATEMSLDQFQEALADTAPRCFKP